jgi:hypothetical protein
MDPIFVALIGNCAIIIRANTEFYKLVWCCSVGLHKILSLLESEDVDVRVHAVKVVANLAAEGDSLSLCRGSNFSTFSRNCRPRVDLGLQG